MAGRPVGDLKRIKVAITLSPKNFNRTKGFIGRLNNRSLVLEDALNIFFDVQDYLKKNEIPLTPKEYVEKLLL